MAETEAILVGQTLGWKPTNDNSHILFGMKDHQGQEFALALTPVMLRQMMIGLIQANGSIEQAITFGSKQQLEALPVKWFNLGEADQPGFGLQFQLDPLGQISFFLDPQIAQHLADALEVAVGQSSTQPVPEKFKN